MHLTLSVTSECTFSAPKTTQKLRSTMKQYRLNNCLLMHCYKSITDTLDAVIIAKNFASANEQLKGHFGKFELGYAYGWVEDAPPPPPLLHLHVSKRSAVSATPLLSPVRYGYQLDTCSRLKKRMKRSKKKIQILLFLFFFDMLPYKV